LVARISIVPLLAVTARFVSSTRVPGPLKTRKLTAPVPAPPETASALVVRYAWGLTGLNTSEACCWRRYSKALLFTVWPKLVENTRTSPRMAPAAVPAVTTICVEPLTPVTVAATPHNVTFVTSPIVPSHKFVPLMTTGNPPVDDPDGGATPPKSIVVGPHFAT